MVKVLPARQGIHMNEAELLAQANTCLTIATAGAILSYIPVGNVASKVGRRKTIRFGTLLLAGSFFAAFIYTMMSDSFSPVLYGLFVLVGMAWAAINVNSLPMVLEMCRGSDIGKFVTPNVEKAVNEKFDERRRNGKL